MTASLVSTVLIVAAIGLIVFAGVVCYRVVTGPSVQDRVVALNVVGTNTAVAIAMLAVAFDTPGFVDVAIVYGLLNFVTSIALARFTATGGDLTWSG
ncbi:monovalent cation/H+ antiporter complex subunit F [Haloarcula marina]|uniref:monovalent cation/H+ antiporter complex subunit F n=1 Tax=Haloarcula marina TaxID=2961574 RepID=UPI0020B86ACD|nr:monovalent cation/H+ antiporter complex subunit F [Halomicroarcula marina]